MREDNLINAMAKYIENLTGSCPADLHNFDNDCANKCSNDIIFECWIKYFREGINNA